jgi:hypothetical protein
MVMSSKTFRSAGAMAALLFSLCTARAYAQHEQVIPQPPDSAQYGRRFFVQLRGVFGRFRDADLQRAFETAEPIQCSELINEKGEWRTVAFFNEKRELGDWYRSNFDEVKNDLSVFQFRGVCRGDHSPVQLTTKFPVTESIDAYDQGRIGLDEVEVNVNAPVSAFFDQRSGAYSFELPYLFLIRQQDGESLFSLDPPHLVDRDKYAPDVTDHWDCKSVTAEAVTYQFLICRTTTLPRNARDRQYASPAFGASAYFILSDGREASSSVKLTFDDANDTPHAVADATAPTAEDTPTPVAWALPEVDERVMDLVRDEFRIRFNAAVWGARVGTSGVLFAQGLSSLASASPQEGADYCIWLPDSRLSPDTPLAYSVTAHDPDTKSGTSIVFDMRALSGAHFGTLKCSFPRATSALSVTIGRWKSIVGDYLSLEVRE